MGIKWPADGLKTIAAAPIGGVEKYRIEPAAKLSTNAVLTERADFDVV
jgi:hypothetical protein